MTDVSQRRLRLRVLATATAMAISSMCVVPAISAERINLSGMQSADQQGFDSFIVKYRDGSSQRASTVQMQSSLDQAARVMPAGRGKGLNLKHVKRLAVQADVVKADRKLDRADAETLMRQIAADPNVEYVEVDARYRAVLTPNDTSFSQQFGFGTGAGGIRATEAWDVTSGAGTVVAVLDTGIVSHSDLNANILPGYDFIIDTATAADGNGRDSDPSDPGDAFGGAPSSWHGTHVAGTVAAVTNNAKGVAGTAFNAKVVPVRVLGKGGGSLSDIADAIVWASGGSVSGVPANPNPAEAINMSLGGGGACSATIQSAINGAVSRGTTLVIAAGNGNTNVTSATPANCNNVIAVGATTSTGARSSFSNYGALVDIAAPGSGILSTLNSGTAGPGAENYASYSGTSMSTPHVAGVVALIQSVSNPAKTPAQIETLLKNTARAFPSTPSQPIGAGIVNAKAAVDAAGGVTPPPPPPPPPSGTQTYTNNADFPINDNATVSSPIAVSGRTGNAPTNASVSVNIVHTYRGDLKVDLVAPDGSVYVLSNRAGGSADNLVATYPLNLSTEALNGTWNLRVNDNANIDTGFINSWSVTF